MMTAAARKQLQAQGWRLVRTFRGPRASGKTTKANRLAGELERAGNQTMKCSEPEETIKTTAAMAVQRALEAFPADHAVRVEASGSQSPAGDGYTNSLRVEITPIWGFVE